MQDNPEKSEEMSQDSAQEPAPETASDTTIVDVEIVDERAGEEAPLSKAEEIGEFTKTLVLAIVLALLIRGFFFEPFNIPSGSMKPTLLVGDYVATNKYTYGYGQYSFSIPIANIFMPVPYQERAWAGKVERGDVVVFWLPSKRQNYIKRVIGLPGDTVQVRAGRLYINEKMVPREPAGLKLDKEPYQSSPVMMTEYIETLPGGIMHSIYEESDDARLDNTPLYTVPEGHYFMMGDNRDNSQDSRVSSKVGPVPFENIVGRADFIFFSTNGSAKVFEFWKWPWSVRFPRLFESIRPIRPSGVEE